MDPKCRVCGEDDPKMIAMTYDKRYDKYRSRGYCRSCHSQLIREGRRSSPEKIRKARDTNLRSMYRISIEEFESMLDHQNGGCAVCGITPSPDSRGGGWYVDHDHSCCNGPKSCGKCVRGVLCNGCNVALGCFKDSIDILMSAASYLIRNESRRQVATG